jgi:trigger factor
MSGTGLRRRIFAPQGARAVFARGFTGLTQPGSLHKVSRSLRCGIPDWSSAAAVYPVNIERLLVNVTVESLAPCRKLVRIEVEAQKVDEAFSQVAKDFQREANLPGFRPGKAPREVVLRKYSKEIEDEARRKLLNESYRTAIDEQKLEVVGSPDIEEIQFGRNQSFLFAATVETAPEFELPEYKGIPVKKETGAVTDEDVDRALESLRQPAVSFNKVERPLQTGDIAVVDYKGTSEGKPLTEIAPTAKGLSERENFWVEMGSGSFIPGFADQLMGASAGEKRTVNVDFPADFVSKDLAGKKAVYEVEIKEVKEKALPPMDDEFAKKYGAESLEKLKEGVRHDLENELKRKQDRSVRSQIIRSLLNRVNFELPESVVARETRNVVYDLVQENAKRGVPRQVIEEQKDQIYTAAAQGAKERVKIGFLLQKIAEKEDIKVAQEEVSQRVVAMAHMYQIPVEKFVKDLQKRNGVIEVFDQIMNEKVLDFLEKNAAIEEVPPGSLNQEAQQ